MADKEKPLEWIASSYKDLMALPPDVRRRFGYALSLAQMGDQDDAAKVLKGFGGAGVLEVVEDEAARTGPSIQSSSLRRCSFCTASRKRARVESPRRKATWTSFALG